MKYLFTPRKKDKFFEIPIYNILSIFMLVLSIWGMSQLIEEPFYFAGCLMFVTASFVLFFRNIKTMPYKKGFMRIVFGLLIIGQLLLAIDSAWFHLIFISETIFLYFSYEFYSS